jgi:hypothetical protein
LELFMAPELCPHCGAEVPANARACPGCGSCEETGWSEEAQADRLDLPDDAFDYSDFIHREFQADQPRPRGIARFWWLVAVILVLLFAAVFTWRFV